jgi:hypothetical protein
LLALVVSFSRGCVGGPQPLSPFQCCSSGSICSNARSQALKRTKASRVDARQLRLAELELITINCDELLLR